MTAHTPIMSSRDAGEDARDHGQLHMARMQRRRAIAEDVSDVAAIASLR
jgi:hypothetical protein